MKRNHDNMFRCWLWFSDNRQEELFEVIQEMITQKLNEMLPKMVEELLRQRIDNLSFDIQTTINGKSSADFREIITNEIMRKMKK